MRFFLGFLKTLKRCKSRFFEPIFHPWFVCGISQASCEQILVKVLEGSVMAQDGDD